MYSMALAFVTTISCSCIWIYDKLKFYICKPQINNTYIKYIILFYLRIFFEKCAALLIYFSNLIYMYFHQGLKNLNVQKMIHHQNWNILFTCVCMYCCENG